MLKSYEIIEIREELLSSMKYVLDDPYYGLCVDLVNIEDFSIWPGSTGDKYHHNYTGGLLQHTADVFHRAVSLGRATSDVTNSDKEFTPVDLNVLGTAAIFHDFSKIKQYQPIYGNPLYGGGDAAIIGWAKNLKFYNQIYHVVDSYSEFMKRSDGILEDVKREAIGHCILAHHGRKEWKSPVEPQTIEAFLLHTADMISARYYPNR